jgi:hypothetical protein
LTSPEYLLILRRRTEQQREIPQSEEEHWRLEEPVEVRESLEISRLLLWVSFGRDQIPVVLLIIWNVFDAHSR